MDHIGLIILGLEEIMGLVILFDFWSLKSLPLFWIDPGGCAFYGVHTTVRGAPVPVLALRACLIFKHVGEPMKLGTD